ncbi:hypothetical protein FHS61_001589 [Altererythrobacter atlanticus]|uniref:Uncharacterized protein n=1 Tax=Croceibacterium atlanticum TaxID=1267766 RepID=A0A0F7KX61_9SPHN|nr:extensin family protein [Croceibacterium atlanticum]AKH44269.1 hypothetical protein WYH_03250 [Croceibacterium atlanticum]MBB5732580.1 hypothetical protein [Croceibacterium atlanticum]
MTRKIALILSALALSGCSMLPSTQGGDPQARRTRSQPAPVAVSPATRQCLSGLAQLGAEYTPLPDRYLDQGCTNLDTVQLYALRSDLSDVAISNLGPVTCGVTEAFAGWTRYGVDRAARQILGSPLRSIETFGSYNCRNVAGTGRRSAHSTAAAIDVAAFVLMDGRRITVKNDWHGGTSDERRFLRTIQQSACKRFDTVLGPEYNRAHEDHLHIEGVIDGKSYCR